MSAQSESFYVSSEIKPKSEIMYVWQVVNVIMAAFFILAAIANMNDDDWYLWVPIYLLPGLLSASIVVKPSFAETKFYESSTVIFFTLCCAYALYQIVLLLEAIGNRLENPLQHEAGREMGGLLIIITWLGVCRFTNIGRPNAPVTSKGLMSALLLMTVTLTVLPLFLWSLCFVSDWHKRIGHCSGMFS
ncbi:transmembrane protein 220-like isoform X2 [Mercenaria mercenaria]|uniref:transmembrane protein 220-like isoform X2 n=1 Tax=Mercenaria mercenaria TaxID=6596 RepID=UPI00234EE234|nr:transmembrane protein 220-like isoform X2 [Mercenaria mercenaria]XP_053391018.1 transmembrane protein 220-like isoform X2 [Mercenaria mercenaria]